MADEADYRRRRVRQWSIVTAAVVAGYNGPGVEPDTTNLVANGGFEVGTGTPESWTATIVPQTATYVTFAWDTLQRHAGLRAVMIAIHPDHPTDAIAYNWTQAVRSGFQAGQTLELTAWVKTQTLPESAWIVAQFLDANETAPLGLATTQTVFTVAGTLDWVRVTISFRVPAGTGVIRLRAGINAPGNAGGAVWFDDVALRQS